MSGYSIFARYYDDLTQNIDYPKRAKQIGALIQKYNPKAKLLLDLACGSGSLSISLAKAGYDVIGADASAEMLSIAMDKTFEAGYRVLFLNQEMDKLDLYGTVDASVCMLDSLNHIGSEEKLFAVFKRVALFTNPDGLFIFDVNTLHKHQDILADNVFVYDMPQVFCCWRNSYHDESGRVDIILDFFTPNSIKSENPHYIRESESFSEWIYQDEVLLRLLEDSGFSHIATLDGDDFKDARKDTERLLYIVKKKS